MSRSFKKQPVVKDRSSYSKQAKTNANQILRKKLSNPEYEIGTGNEYRKHTETYDIHDYVCRWPLEEALKMYREPNNKKYTNYWKEKYKTEEEFIKAWKKEMIRK